MNSYTLPATISEITVLKTYLTAQKFTFKSQQYTYFVAQAKEIRISAYQKGPKILLQGKQCGYWLEKITTNKILTATKEVATQTINNDIALSLPCVGTDESGKGDLFGPLVIAGVVVANQQQAQQLQQLGVADSKSIQNKAISTIAEGITNILPKKQYRITVVSPAQYNVAYQRWQNLNHLLAHYHAQLLAELHAANSCQLAIVDKFASSQLVLSAYQNISQQPLNLKQENKAEKYLPVAAASILARHSFVNYVEHMSQQFSFPFALGASQTTQQQITSFVQQYSAQQLTQVGKLHFKSFTQFLL